jgi:hypothetical protein
MRASVRSFAAWTLAGTVVGATSTCATTARAQTLDLAGGAGGAGSDSVPPGIPALYCPDCEKPERVRVLARLALPITFGGVLGRANGDGFHALQIGARPELTLGRIGERSQHAGRVHVGAYGEALGRLGAGGSSDGPRALFGGGATVALTTGEVTGASLSLGAFAGHAGGAAGGWHAGGVASFYVGAWMPDDAIALVPSLGVRVDARWTGASGAGGSAWDAERSVSVSLQIDPVMVGLLIVGLAG